MKAKFLALIFFVLFILSNVNAAILINTSNHYRVEVANVELRSDYSSYYSNSITANDGDAIDIRAELFLDYYDYYGDSDYYYDWVEAWAEIYGWNDGWIYLKDTPTRKITLNYLNYKTVNWHNAFFIDDPYEQYKVIVYARDAGYFETSSNFAYVDTVNSGFDSYCSDIEIFDNSVAMNENETEYMNFNIKNNSNERFYIKGVSPVEYESFIWLSAYTNDSSIRAGETGQVKLKVVSSEVNKDKTGSFNLRIKGEFATERSCSYFDIEKEFPVKVYNYSSNESCGDIKIYASDETMKEDNTDYFSFKVRNYSDTGFYIDNFDIYESSSFFNATEDYKPSFIPGNADREFKYKVSSENVSYDQTGKIKISIAGHYSGGDHCSYSEIGEERITLTIEKDYWNEKSYCDDLTLRTKTLHLDESDSYSTSFSIENNSNKRFNIDDVELEENSPYLNFRNIDFPSYISSNSDRSVSFDVETENISSDKSLTAYFKVRGEFENGRTCSFSDTRKSFRARINNSGYSGTSSCNQINVLTKTVELNKGETKNFNFKIENNSNRRFYINHVRVYDNDSGIESKEYNSPSSISANGNGTITARIKAKDNAETKAYIEITGNFQNGRSCSANEIGRESFTIRVKGRDSCSDFSLDAPSIKSILGEEEITININNPSNKQGTIKLSGTNLAVSPHTIEISRNYSTTKIINVELLEGKESFLVYNVSLKKCNIPSKTTKIISSLTSFEIADYPKEKTIGLKDKISFTIKNNSSTSREFKISLDTPENWKVNKKSVIIPGNSDRTISLNLEAEEGKYKVKLIVKSAGKTTEKEIELTVTEEEKEIQVSAETKAGILNELELTITVNNQSDKLLEGNLIIELPEEWTLEGNTKVSVEPETKKEILFKLKTDGKNLEQEIPVALEVNSGQKIDTQTEFKTAGLGTALVSLAQNAGIITGLLVIVIIVVILLVKK